MSLAMWGDGKTGEYVLIGDEDCQPGDLVIAVPVNEENIIRWIKVLIKMLDDGELENVPGEFVKCTKVE